MSMYSCEEPSLGALPLGEDLIALEAAARSTYDVAVGVGLVASSNKYISSMLSKSSVSERLFWVLGLLTGIAGSGSLREGEAAAEILSSSSKENWSFSVSIGPNLTATE